jgi:hypothetical protein
VLAIVASSSFPVTAQAAEWERLPEAAMGEVVGRLLRYYFKSRPRPTTILLNQSGLREHWLAEIRNVEFKLVADSVSDYSYRFREIEPEDAAHRIVFGYGISFGGSGPIWKIKRTKKGIRLWPTGDTYFWSEAVYQFPPSKIPKN